MAPLLQLGDEREYNEKDAGFLHSWTALLDSSPASNPGAEMGHDLICQCRVCLFICSCPLFHILNRSINSISHLACNLQSPARGFCCAHGGIISRSSAVCVSVERKPICTFSLRLVPISSSSLFPAICYHCS